ncbi:rhodanese-like domain-containing protein [Pontibacillus yanchengensis]|uniref:Rhodanese-like domain-containing protein n=2 Tax=Pontibacillus yanchengensis TaxID=462910 RepID=A0ACC7VDC5_9BACI|nr:rhodanese-like domain-containing protein [Pontibacillus yanchengensis]MYL32193.1 rhodanese-like domain-containing protein [Pontibacillus yanchengensis]MYL52773.1 rhodanese-like domain-containing protein [Pontibacillus yanchengensis]
MYIVFGITALVLFFVMRRYVPVAGVDKINVRDVEATYEEVIMVDTRAYQTSAIEANQEAFCIPLPYLNRHYTDIPDKDVVLISTDSIEKNLATRLLRKKGYNVVGYTIPEEGGCCYALRCASEK